MFFEGGSLFIGTSVTSQLHSGFCLHAYTSQLQMGEDLRCLKRSQALGFNSVTPRSFYIILEISALSVRSPRVVHVT
jgi:hypothetical protein